MEDDPRLLALMGEVFTSFDAEVLAVQDGKAAEDLIQKQPFDGIFLDLHLPKVHGLQLAQQARQSEVNGRTPIVAVTGAAGSDTMQAAFRAGASFFLPKPFDRERLVRLFRAVQGVMTVRATQRA